MQWLNILFNILNIKSPPQGRNNSKGYKVPRTSGNHMWLCHGQALVNPMTVGRAMTFTLGSETLGLWC